MSAPQIEPGEYPQDHIAGVKVDGQRLDQYLAGQFSDSSRSLIRKAIDAGTETVNGQPQKASYRVKTGDAIRIWLPKPAHGRPIPEEIPLDVLDEADWP